MPLIFSADSFAASASADALGAGPCRVYVKALGSLTSCHVLAGSDLDHLSTLDSSTFDSMTTGQTRQLLVAEPVNVLVLQPVGASIDARITSALDWD